MLIKKQKRENLLLLFTKSLYNFNKNKYLIYAVKNMQCFYTFVLL